LNIMKKLLTVLILSLAGAAWADDHEAVNLAAVIFQVISNKIAGFAGYFFIPITAFALGFIVKKSTGKNWGYVLAGVLLFLQLLMMAIVFFYKNQG